MISKQFLMVNLISFFFFLFSSRIASLIWGHYVKLSSLVLNMILLQYAKVLFFFETRSHEIYTGLESTM